MDEQNILHFSEDIERAATELENNPNDINSLVTLASHHIDTNNYKDAIAYLNRLLVIDENNLDLYHTLGSCYFKEQMYNEAIDTYHKVIDLKPNHTNAHRAIATIYMQINNIDAAISYIEKAITYSPSNDEYYLILGNCHLYSENYEEAIKNYEIAAAIQPNADLYNNIGIAHIKSNKIEQAKESFYKAIELNPNDIKPRCNLGKIFIDNNDLSKAEEQFNVCDKIDIIDVIPIYIDFCNRLYSEGQNIALAEYAKKIDYNLNFDADSLIKLIDISTVSEHYDNLSILLGKFLAISLDEQQVILGKYTKTNSTLSADVFYKHMQDKMEQENPDILFLIFYGLILLSEDNKIKSQKILEKTVTLAPDSPYTYLFLSLNLFKQGNYSGCIICNDLAQNLNNQIVDSYKLTALSYLALNEIDNAIDKCESCLKLFPENNSILYTMGEILSSDNNLSADTIYLAIANNAVNNFKTSNEIFYSLDEARAIASLYLHSKNICDWQNTSVYLNMLKIIINEQIETSTSLNSFFSNNLFYRLMSDIDLRKILLDNHFSTDSIDKFKNYHETDINDIKLGVIIDSRDKYQLNISQSIFDSSNQIKIYVYDIAANDDKIACASWSKYSNLQQTNFIDAAKIIYADRVDIIFDLTDFNHLVDQILRFKPCNIQCQLSTNNGYFDKSYIDKNITYGINLIKKNDKNIKLSNTLIPITDNINTPIDDNKADTAIYLASILSADLITEETFELWMQTVVSTPNSKLILANISDSAQDMLLSYVRAKGINQKQIEFQSIDYCLVNADIFLLPLNNNITNYHASLIMLTQKPAVCLKNKHFDISANISFALGNIEQYIATNKKEYQSYIKQILAEDITYSEDIEFTTNIESIRNNLKQIYQDLLK